MDLLIETLLGIIYVTIVDQKLIQGSSVSPLPSGLKELHFSWKAEAMIALHSVVCSRGIGGVVS